MGKTIKENSVLIAERHTPQYLMHKYYARRPYNVFQHIIEKYSKEGDVVLDCFCGGGVTIFESCKLHRKAIGVDINPLASFITKMQLFSGDVKVLEDELSDFISGVEQACNSYYHISLGDDTGQIVWVEWAYVVKCPYCGEDIVLTEDNKISNGIYHCSNTNCPEKEVKRIDCKSNGSVPIRVKYISDMDHTTKIHIFSIDERKKFSTSIPHPKDYDNYLKPEFKIPKNWDRQSEDKLFEKGIIYYKDFFTDRNFMVNAIIFDNIISAKKSGKYRYIDYIYFMFSSSLRYSNNMSRVSDNWEGGKPTSMDKHAFWLPNQYVEVNIMMVLNSRKKAIIKGCSFSKENLPNLKEVAKFNDLLNNDNSFMVLNQSSSSLPIPANSVDAVVTDPPYGSNVQYAELSTIWNAWYQLYASLDNYIYNAEEAVVNRKSNFDGSKSEDDYEKLLYDIYVECNRVLKDKGVLTFTFNNKNIKVWIAMLSAVSRAGFTLSENGVIFQDFINSYKNTAHLKYAGNVHGDFIYTFIKGKHPKKQLISSKSLKAILNETIESEIIRLYELQKSYTTPELYQKIMSKITIVIMQYIEQNEREFSISEVKDISPNFIDKSLKEHLLYDAGIWVKARS